jgi:uroporphyrinogen-III synthase
LYPCSCRASTELQDGLAARSCAVTRMNTYDTVPASSLPPDARQLAAQAAVVTFASPSAIKAYVKLLLPSPPLAAGCEHPHPPVACIGHTSAAAAVRAGLRRVHYPDSPGVEGWALAVQAALRGDAPRDRELLEAAQAREKPQDDG